MHARPADDPARCGGAGGWDTDRVTDPALPTDGSASPTGPVGAGDLTEQLLAVAVDAARRAGAELMRRYGHVEGLESKSTATDPVSDADRAAERLLVEIITAARPDDAMIGEEGTARPGTTGLTWVVDPLDGTVNYLYQLGGFAVSVAVEDAGCAPADGLVGVVFDPVRDRLFTAVRGGPALLHDAAGVTTLRVTDPVPMGRALVATGFGYAAENRRRQGAFIAGLLPHIRDIRRMGGAALDFCHVAAGYTDAYFEEGIHHWDHAAGAVIARAAGATVVPFTPTGAERGWLAAGPALAAQLQDHLRSPGDHPAG